MRRARKARARTRAGSCRSALPGAAPGAAREQVLRAVVAAPAGEELLVGRDLLQQRVQLVQRVTGPSGLHEAPHEEAAGAALLGIGGEEGLQQVDGLFRPTPALVHLG